jgi:hypothetical protein
VTFVASSSKSELASGAIGGLWSVERELETQLTSFYSLAVQIFSREFIFNTPVGFIGVFIQTLAFAEAHEALTSPERVCVYRVFELNYQAGENCCVRCAPLWG